MPANTSSNEEATQASASARPARATPAASAGPASPPGPARQGGRIKRFLLGAPTFHLALIVLLALATAGSAVWRLVSIYTLKKELAATQRHEREVMIAREGELLQLSAIPLAWAIRAALLDNDIGDVDAYMRKLIHEKYVKRIIFVDASGSIASSTNLKLKGQPATLELPGVELSSSKPRVDRIGDDLRIIVPVMDFEHQIGTLVLDYLSMTSGHDHPASAERRP